MKMFDAGKTRMIALPYGEKSRDDMLSRFHMIPERNGQTDVYRRAIKMDANCTVNVYRTTVTRT